MFALLDYSWRSSSKHNLVLQLLLAHCSSLSASYYPLTQVCCNNKIFTGTACCGSIAYNSITQTCCNNQVVLAGGPNYLCCYSNALSTWITFDSHSEICCQGTKWPNRGVNNRVNLCCGTNGYTMGVESCCGSTVIWGSTKCCGSQPCICKRKKRMEKYNAGGC